MILGLIGGSGLLKSKLAVLQNLKEETVATAHGRVFLRCGAIGSHTLVFVQRHDARPCRTYTQPADINYPAISLALKAKVRYWKPRGEGRVADPPSLILVEHSPLLSFFLCIMHMLALFYSPLTQQLHSHHPLCVHA